VSDVGYQSTGFPTLFRTTVNEECFSCSVKRQLNEVLSLRSLVGLSYHYTHALSDRYLNDRVDGQDRRDLSKPITLDKILTPCSRRLS